MADNLETRIGNILEDAGIKKGSEFTKISQSFARQLETSINIVGMDLESFNDIMPENLKKNKKEFEGYQQYHVTKIIGAHSGIEGVMVPMLQTSYKTADGSEVKVPTEKTSEIDQDQKKMTPVVRYKIAQAIFDEVDSNMEADKQKSIRDTLLTYVSGDIQQEELNAAKDEILELESNKEITKLGINNGQEIIDSLNKIKEGFNEQDRFYNMDSGLINRQDDSEKNKNNSENQAKRESANKKSDILVKELGNIDKFLDGIEDKANEKTITKVKNVIKAGIKVAFTMGLSEKAKEEFKVAKDLLNEGKTQDLKASIASVRQDLKDKEEKRNKLITGEAKKEKPVGFNTKPAKKSPNSRGR